MINIDKIRYKETLIGLLIGVCVAVITFPENEWTFSVGIDPSLKWLYNWLFEHGLTIGKDIIFPHGPLAFLMYPLPGNIIMATAFLIILKILLVINITHLIEQARWIKWLSAFLFTYVLSVVSGINHIILANIILLYCNYFRHTKIAYKMLAFVITAIAFYIKSYVAILSTVLCFSFLLYYLLFVHKSIKKTGIDVTVVLGIILFVWLLMYGTLQGFVGYVIGMFHLAQDNSSAASYYPQNNWLVLGISFIIIVVLLFVNRTKKTFFFGILVSLSLFAAWKHGMAREDIYHVKGFIVYVGLVLFVLIFFHQQNKLRNLILSGIVIFLLGVNSKNAVNSHLLKFDFFGAGNFIEFVMDFSNLKNQSLQKSKKNIASNKLPPNIRDSIYNSTVDIYPWDYSIVPANNLNWKPRPVIQSYASYTHWLDKQNAMFFDSKDAPEFVIWEMGKISKDINGSNLNSIDNRHLLNDEPQTIVQLLENYNHFYTDQKFLVLKKRDTPAKAVSNIVKTEKAKWGKWLRVPQKSASLLRAKIDFKKSMLQRLKSFFYKDEQFWIYLKLKNGLIHKYRIVPKNAKDGVWINPYIFDLNKIYEVEEVMFKCSNQKIIAQHINIEWEQIQFENEAGFIRGVFTKEKLKNDSIVFTSINNFEKLETVYWSKTDQTLQVPNPFSGKQSFISKPNSFSTSFTYPLDSILFGEYRFFSDCWIKSPDYKYSKNASLVLVVEDENGSVLWKGQPVDEQLLDKNYWNNISSVARYNHTQANCSLKAYLWNKSDAELFIDDFRVIIQSENIFDEFWLSK